MSFEPNLLYRMLEEEFGIDLPSDLFKGEILEKLNRAIYSSNPAIVHKVFRELSENVEKYLEIEKLVYVLELGESLKSKAILSDDDKKIIKFLIQTPPGDLKGVLRTVTSLYHVSNVLKELEGIKRENLPIDNLRIHTALSCFMQLYEVLTSKVDQRVHVYLRQNPMQGSYARKYLSIPREHGKHATVGQVNRALGLVLNLKINNASIFGTNSGCRSIRNNFAHANLSYDSDNKVIIAGNEKLSIEDFLLECSRLFMFGLRWLKRSIENEYNSTDYVNTLVKEIRKLFISYSKESLGISRSSRRRNGFHTLVSQWKKKALS